jgi:hypothetical protein
MSQVPKKTYRNVIPKSATVRIYTNDRQRQSVSKPLSPEKKSFLSYRRDLSNQKNIPKEDKEDIPKGTKNPARSAVTKERSNVRHDEIKGYMRPKSGRSLSNAKLQSAKQTTPRQSTRERKNLVSAIDDRASAQNIILLL